MTAWVLLLAGLVSAPGLGAGNAAYEQGNFAEAVAHYEALAAENYADPVLFYNLGNAYFREGNVAGAIANYERALQLDPRMALAEANLRYALAATPRNMARPISSRWEETLLFWDDSLRTAEVRVLALGTWIAFWGMLFWRLLDRRKGQVLLAGILLAAAAGFMVSLYAKSTPLQLAVAAPAEVNVRTGASEADTLRFTLKTGDRVRVETESDGWLRVATVDGERGWAPADAFLRVGPPYATFPQESSP